MSDLAKHLLSQYYGIGEDSSNKRFPSSYLNSDDLRNQQNESLDEQTCVLEDEKNDSLKEDSQEYFDGTENANVSSDCYVKSSRVLTDLDLYDTDDAIKCLEISEIDLGPNILCDGSSSSKCLLGIDGNVPLSTENRASPQHERLETCGGSLAVIDDGLSDNASDIFPIGGTKKSRKSCTTSGTLLPPKPKKRPIYNDTFTDLSDMKLMEFPMEILGKWSTLRRLYLGSNKLTRLPEEIFMVFKHLEWLDVRNNEISSLPSSIKSHQCLESLLLQENKIEKLPLEICTLRNLKNLHVAQNPLVVPPKEIVALGQSAIIGFLRDEWNKLHPEEQIDTEIANIEPKWSTIICYQSPRNSRKPQQLLGPKTSSLTRKEMSVKDRSRSYRPSNRCRSNGVNSTKEQQQLWIAKAKEVLSQQALILQRIKDEKLLKQWRRDTRSFSKAMENARNRNECNIPFATDLEEYSAISKKNSTSERLNKKRMSMKNFLLHANPELYLDKRISELVESMNALEMSTSKENLTPRIKQDNLRCDMEKILEIQNEIQFLKEYCINTMKC